MADKKGQEQSIAISIDWHFPEGMTTRYANNMMVQFGDQDCYISFFEIRPPVLLGSPEEQAEQAKKIRSLKAECIARIAVSAGKMPEFVEALKTTLQAYQARAESAK